MSIEELYAQTQEIDFDNSVDVGIRECLQLGSGKSFITFAGAGSGKTYSLKQALDHLKSLYEADFSRQGKQVAVITYTNNAADEITDRIERNPIFSISTIHSFCWSTIAGFNSNIQQWYLDFIPPKLAQVEADHARLRGGTKAAEKRERDIARYKKKLDWLSEPRVFKYDPNGVNSSPESLSHDDVLKLFAHFLEAKPMMAELLINKYPFIFVDESQDTDKGVINALFSLQSAHPEKIVIGLFGDTMQRIFGGGEPQLGKSLPENWIEFNKQVNHRSAKRIVGLGNKIRQQDDQRLQFARSGSDEGTVRFFLLPFETSEKEKAEENIRITMAEVTGDTCWSNVDSEDTAILLLEHKMVSRRLGFIELTDTLSQSEKIKDRIFEGENSELNYFSKFILPLAEASLQGNRFEVMSQLRLVKSSLLEEDVFTDNSDDPLKLARLAEEALRDVVSNNTVTFKQVLSTIAEHRLLPIPIKLKPLISPDDSERVSDDIFQDFDLEFITDNIALSINSELDHDESTAWSNALETPFWQIQKYRDYIEERSIYRTHQGVKGNEFERVMAIMDDDEAGGFMFSYEQYLDAKEPSANTIAKLNAGEDTGIDRTRRLFYVTSTRAKSSLAHVIYTSDVGRVRASLLERGFALADEIIGLST